MSGIDRTLNELKWKRFAGGLYEPMGLRIVDDVLYATCKDRLTRLHDLNDDGEADFYENFSNQAVQTLESREFPLDMVTRPGGGFYLAKGGALNAGPSTSPAVMSGFRAGGPHSGSVVEVLAGRKDKTDSELKFTISTRRSSLSW